MQLKPTSIDVDPEQPFKNDLLSRLPSAEMLTGLLASVREPLVLSIDAPWGAGKTTFLRMWQQHLKNNSFATLYFNAWENDFTNDALVSLIGELGLGLEELIRDKKSRSSAGKVFKKVSKIGANLVKVSIPVAVKIATAGALDLDNFSKQAVAALTESIAREQIEKYEKSKSSIAAFREQLRTFVEKIASGSDECETKPLVLIIDELDRCRPTYAIEVLERAKHFFNVQGLVFVLAVDKGQICHSIKSVYGTGMDVDGYLKRFIDLEYILPRPEKESFCKALFGRFSLDQYFAKRQEPENWQDKELFLRMFTELFHVFDSSLREQEQCFSQLSIALRTTPENKLIFPQLLGFLIVLKARNLDLYKRFVSGKAGPGGVIEYIRTVPRGDEFLKDHHGIALVAYLFTCGHDIRAQEQAESSYRAYVNDSLPFDNEGTQENQILTYIQRISFDSHFGILPYLVNKIDLVSRFSV
ncbi:MAG: P-loop NTPase fold protein [Desulfomonilaceae bacterium]